MNQNQNTVFDEQEIDLEKKNKKGNIIAFIVCVLLAFTLWLVIRNTNDKGTTVPQPPVTDQTTESTQ